MSSIMGRSIRRLLRYSVEGFTPSILECSIGSITWFNGEILVKDDPTLLKALDRAGYGVIREFQPVHFQFLFRKQGYEGLQLRGSPGERESPVDIPNDHFNKFLKTAGFSYYIPLTEAEGVVIQQPEQLYGSEDVVRNLRQRIEEYNTSGFVKLIAEDGKKGFCVRREAHEYVMKVPPSSQRKKIRIYAPIINAKSESRNPIVYQIIDETSAFAGISSPPEGGFTMACNGNFVHSAPWLVSQDLYGFR